MTVGPAHVAGTYSHDLLLHEGIDDVLVESTREFVRQGLDSGSPVLVHGDAERVAYLRRVLGEPSGLMYGVDRVGLYEAPMRTLWGYQDRFSESDRQVEVWSTGPVPLTGDSHEDAAWLRYESAVNEALGPYPFHGLCTYDAARLPEDTLIAARATHPHVNEPAGRFASTEYLPPADFLAGPLAGIPMVPDVEPTLMTVLENPYQLGGARYLLHRTAAASFLPAEVVENFVGAVNEVLVNGIVHGLSSVEVRIWAGPGSLSCEVSDDGPGVEDPLVGFARPSGGSAVGLWVARRLCDEVIVQERPEGGTRVLLVTTR